MERVFQRHEWRGRGKPGSSGAGKLNGVGKTGWCDREENRIASALKRKRKTFNRPECKGGSVTRFYD